jgi:hypothetical protein
MIQAGLKSGKVGGKASLHITGADQHVFMPEGI